VAEKPIVSCLKGLAEKPIDLAEKPIDLAEISLKP
jgi:hypothetical protein